MSSNRRKLLLNTVTVSLGCRCRRPKLSDIFHPKPKSKKPHNHSSSSSTSWNNALAADYMNRDDSTHATTTSTSTAFYSDTDSDMKSTSSEMVINRGFGRVGGDSLAVEKESDDPYFDFRHSMLQMILEKEIYSKDDLRELLDCFLKLNSPNLHGVIVRAFTEIWNGVYSVKSAASVGFRC